MSCAGACIDQLSDHKHYLWYHAPVRHDYYSPRVFQICRFDTAYDIATTRAITVPFRSFTAATTSTTAPIYTTAPGRPVLKPLDTKMRPYLLPGCDTIGRLRPRD